MIEIVARICLLTAGIIGFVVGSIRAGTGTRLLLVGEIKLAIGEFVWSVIASACASALIILAIAL